MMSLTMLASSGFSLHTTAAPFKSVSRSSTAPRMSIPADALGAAHYSAALAMPSVVSTLLAEESSAGINPLFLLLGALPLVAAGAFVFVSGEEKKIAERRADPANASRLGYTAEEVEGMEELTRLRYESDLKDFNEAVAQAAADGRPPPNGLTWRAEKAAQKAGYFDAGSNERPTMI